MVGVRRRASGIQVRKEETDPGLCFLGLYFTEGDLCTEEGHLSMGCDRSDRASPVALGQAISLGLPLCAHLLDYL